MSKLASTLLLTLLGLIGLGLSYAVISLPHYSQGLNPLVAKHLDQSGVSHPVTAVLLNFRAYDTLLEMAVLFLALVAMWSLTTPPPQPASDSATPILISLFHVLIPIMLLVAGYLLWVGAYAPGGAFQAGSVLAAAGVLMLLSGQSFAGRFLGWPLRLAVVLGTTLFVTVAAGIMLSGAQLLQYPLNWAGELILFIEIAATLSIGITLTLLFLGLRPTESDS